MCSLVINGAPHGPNRATTTCQLYMRHFNDGETIVIEPFRAGAFPVLKDLIVEPQPRFDRIQQAGGFISVRTGSAQDANCIPVAETGRRPRHGRRGLHRVRRLRGRLPERQRHALPAREGLPLRAPAARPARAHASAS